jgi:hypothetical protein
LIGQAIFHDESHGQGHDAVRVVGFGQTIGGGVRVKELVTLGAAVLRIDQFDIAGLPRNKVAHIM